jgi:transcriptional regulator with XRE-family HTH domain
VGRTKIIPFPKHQRLLAALGENLRLARLRRKLSAQQISERAGISRSTLGLLEQGSVGSSIGALLQVLVVLGLAEDLAAVARDDAMGRKLMDAGLGAPKARALRQRKSSTPAPPQ